MFVFFRMGFWFKSPHIQLEHILSLLGTSNVSVLFQMQVIQFRFKFVLRL